MVRGTIQVMPTSGFVSLKLRGDVVRDDFIRVALGYRQQSARQAFLWDLTESNVAHLTRCGFRTLATVTQTLFARGREKKAALVVGRSADGTRVLSHLAQSGSPSHAVEYRVFLSAKKAEQWLGLHDPN